VSVKRIRIIEAAFQTPGNLLDFSPVTYLWKKRGEFAAAEPRQHVDAAELGVSCGLPPSRR
jgi:hypothetical protein